MAMMTSLRWAMIMMTTSGAELAPADIPGVPHKITGVDEDEESNELDETTGVDEIVRSSDIWDDPESCRTIRAESKVLDQFNK